MQSVLAFFLLLQGALGDDLLTVLQTRSLPSCCQDPDLKSCVAVKINPATLGKKSLALPSGITLDFKDNNDDDRNSYSFEGNGNEATIVFDPKSGGLHGHATTDDGSSYMIENCGAEGHVWKEIDMSKLEEFDDYSPEEIGNATLRSEEALLNAVEDRNTIVTYSVKIYYTSAFAAITPDIAGYFRLLMDETNRGYINSRVPLRIKLHCTEQTTVPDGLGISDTLNRFERSKGSTAALRGSADVAALFVRSFSDRRYCGMARLFAIDRGNTMSVTRKGCQYTFAHEVGHNIGLYHNRETGHINPRYRYGQGYLIPRGRHSSGFRTILAYYDRNHPSRTNYYSNPSVIHPVTGTATGNSATANNARVLTEMRFRLAALGNEATRCGTSPTVCNGGSTAWSCCTSSNRCAVGGGDCDRDTDCQPGLKCGTNNCRSFHPGAQAAADCCIRSTGTCNGDSKAWSCCRTSSRCRLREGDCDNDSECQPGLVCGSNNCRQFHPGAHSLADCCIPRPRTLRSVACEGRSLGLRCGSGTRIKITYANYGRRSQYTCRGTRDNLRCYHSGSTNIVKSRCENRQSCIVPASNSVFRDPCFGIYKYLEVYYSCMPATSGRQLESSDEDAASDRTDNSGEPSEVEDAASDRTDNSGEPSEDEAEEESIEVDFKDPAESKEAEDVNWGPDDVVETSEDD